MATKHDQDYQVETDDEDNDELHKFLYEDYTIEDLSDESGDDWYNTYHALLEKLDEITDS